MKEYFINFSIVLSLIIAAIFFAFCISSSYESGKNRGVVDGMCKAYEGYVISYDPPVCNVNNYVVDLRSKQ